jgi:hypothetical protein
MPFVDFLVILENDLLVTERVPFRNTVLAILGIVARFVTVMGYLGMGLSVEKHMDPANIFLASALRCPSDALVSRGRKGSISRQSKCRLHRGRSATVLGSVRPVPSAFATRQ